MLGKKSFSLSKDELGSLSRDGFIAPLEFCSPDQASLIRDYLDTHVLKVKSGISSCGFVKSRHLDDYVAYSIGAHQAIVDRVSTLLGPNIVLWRSQFFIKNPGDKEIPWHHDANFLPIAPAENVSAWVALDPADDENSCLQFLPGSHKKSFSHVSSLPNMAFPKMVELDAGYSARAVSVPLKPGQFVIFSDRVLHHSNPNTSCRRRLGFALRYTHPGVRIDLHLTNPGQYGIVVKGTDTHRINQYLNPPVANAAACKSLIA